MKAKEKAKELITKFSPLVTTWDCYNDVPVDDEEIIADAKKCAIIAVDEIIEVFNFTHIGYGKDIINGLKNTKLNYWHEVKRCILELEKINSK